MYFPSKEDYRKLSKDYKLVPVYKEVIVDMETPISIFKKVASYSEDNYLLESVEGGNNLARYSFIGLETFLTFTYKNSKGIIREGLQENVLEGPPLEILKDLLDKYKGPDLQGLPRFYGGAVGYLGYDIIKSYEDVPSNAQDDLNLPQTNFIFTNLVLIFDHVKHKLKIVVNTRPNTEDPIEEYEKAMLKIEKIIKLIRSNQKSNTCEFTEVPKTSVRSNVTKEEFMEKVETAKEYIKAGDIFQVVLSQRLETELTCSPFEIYRSLRTINPAPYLYYLNFGDTKIIGSSPEMLVRVEDGNVQTCPIAGTRPRGKDEQEDLFFAEDLLNDEKEKAEHLMLVDLGRNDLGRVCEYGSVRVTDYMFVERYSHVMHLVTNLQGKLNSSENGFSALKAAFPAGTVSGAPKIRAMEIIDELENTNRGIYAGAIGYFSFTGNLDTCITIRTLVINDNKIYIQAGAGIVADSKPEKEYEETLNKAKVLLKTLQLREAVS